MNKILELIRKGNLRGLLIDKTNDSLLQFCRYIFVGGAAFLADWGALFLLERAGLHYLSAACPAFFIGLAVNYALSKKMVFTEKLKSPAAEFSVYGIIGLVGLGLTEALMYLFTGVLGLYFMLSKPIAAAIVLFWNFAARKAILYRKKNS